MEPDSMGLVAGRLAALLDGGGVGLGGDGHGGLVAEQVVTLSDLPRGQPPADLWAIDGGQATVADARCVAVVVVRVARARWRGGSCVVQEVGPLRPHLLGGTSAGPPWPTWQQRAWTCPQIRGALCDMIPEHLPGMGYVCEENQP